MQNDDLGQFPKPPQTDKPFEDKPTPIVDANTPAPDDTLPSVPSFEETPDEIPSFNHPATSQPVAQTPPAPPAESTPPPVLSDTFTDIPSPYISKETQAEPVPIPQPIPTEPVLATFPAQSGLNMRSVVFVFIFIMAVIAVGAAAFLFQRTLSLQQQLKDLTQTLSNREVFPITTPTPSIVELPTPTASLSALIATPTATPTLSVYEPGTPLRPLSLLNKIMQIAIKHQPNAQLILLKSENAHDPLRTSTKYFFRQDLTTKKYFYILVSGKEEPQIVDKNIFVTPDNNIPSLNDLILKNKLGIDLDEALSLAVNSCVNTTVCATASATAQYIQTATNVIWQISLNFGAQKEPAVIQIDAQTKAIIFKTADFVGM